MTLNPKLEILFSKTAPISQHKTEKNQELTTSKNQKRKRKNSHLLDRFSGHWRRRKKGSHKVRKSKNISEMNLIYYFLLLLRMYNSLYTTEIERLTKKIWTLKVCIGREEGSWLRLRRQRQIFCLAISSLFGRKCPSTFSLFYYVLFFFPFLVLFFFEDFFFVSI